MRPTVPKLSCPLRFVTSAVAGWEVGLDDCVVHKAEAPGPLTSVVPHCFPWFPAARVLKGRTYYGIRYTGFSLVLLEGLGRPQQIYHRMGKV